MPLLYQMQRRLTAHLTAADDGDFLPGRRRITEDFRGGNGRLRTGDWQHDRSSAQCGDHGLIALGL